MLAILDLVIKANDDDDDEPTTQIPDDDDYGNDTVPTTTWPVENISNISELVGMFMFGKRGFTTTATVAEDPSRRNPEVPIPLPPASPPSKDDDDDDDDNIRALTSMLNLIFAQDNDKDDNGDVGVPEDVPATPQQQREDEE